MPELAGAVWAAVGFGAGCGFVGAVWVITIAGLPRRRRAARTPEPAATPSH